MEKILKGIQHFQQHVFPKKRLLFEQLATGQRPETLFVGCSDSRLSLDLITQTSPGDIFVCRNAGNIVPPRHEAEAVSATIEFAVSALKIRHIVICGHSDCGAMKGLLHPEKVVGMPHVSRWLRHGEGARRALDELHPGATEREALIAITKLNVRLQLNHLETHPQVFAHLRTGNLKLHGWVFQIETGEIEAWDETEGCWTNLAEKASEPLAEMAYVSGD
ncbi:MAG: carbonic anhydrase [Bryobacteraceae bacterium]